MIGRTPGHIQAIRPLKDGVIADFDICEKMLRYFIQRVHPRRWAKPRMVICVPSGHHRRRAARRAGSGRVRGRAQAGRTSSRSRWPPRSAPGCRCTSPPATWSSTSVAARPRSRSSRSAASSRASRSASRGDELDEAIITYVKKEYSLALGERTAEEIKIALASAYPLEEELYAEIRGRDLVTGSAEDDRRVDRGDPRSDRGAGVGDRRRGQGHARQDAARARGRHHGEGHRHHRWRRAAARPRPPARTPRPACRSSIAPNPLYSVVIGSGQCLEEFDALKQVLMSSQRS